MFVIHTDVTWCNQVSLFILLTMWIFWFQTLATRVCCWYTTAERYTVKPGPKGVSIISLEDRKSSSKTDWTSISRAFTTKAQQLKPAGCQSQSSDYLIVYGSFLSSHCWVHPWAFHCYGSCAGSQLRFPHHFEGHQKTTPKKTVEVCIYVHNSSVCANLAVEGTNNLPIMWVICIYSTMHHNVP